MSNIVKSNIVEVADDVVEIKEPIPAFTDDGGEESAAVRAAYMRAVAEMKAQQEEWQEKADAQAQRMYGSAVQQAKAECAALRAQAELDAKAMYEKAAQDGYAEGARNAAEQVRTCAARLEDTIVNIERDIAVFEAQYEKDLKWLALEIASKVLNKRITENPADMAELVRGAMESMGKTKWMTIEISDTMTELVDTLRGTLRAGDYTDKLTIRPVEAPAGSCIVDAPDRMLDASVDTQLANLRAYFAQEVQP